MWIRVAYDATRCVCTHADIKCKSAISRVTLNGATKPFYFVDDVAVSGLLRVGGRRGGQFGTHSVAVIKA